MEAEKAARRPKSDIGKTGGKGPIFASRCHNLELLPYIGLGPLFALRARTLDLSVVGERLAQGWHGESGWITREHSSDGTEHPVKNHI